MTQLDSDLAFMLSDFDALPVSVRGVVTRGHLSEMDVLTDQAYGDLQTRRTTIRVPRADLTDADGALIVQQGDVAVIGVNTYTVTEVTLGDPAEIGSIGHDGRELLLRVVRV